MARRRKTRSEEEALRGIAEMSASPRMRQKVRYGLKGLRASLTLDLLASELLELGDVAQDQGLTTAEFAHRLLRTAWEALRGRPLGVRYELTPETTLPSGLHRDMLDRIRRAAAGEAYGRQPQDSLASVPQEEALEESRRSGGSQEEPAED